MNRFHNVIFGQKAFIINDAKEVLIIKRKNVDIFQGYWDVPGGKIEEGDSLFQGLAREIKEEVGLKLERIILCLSTSKFEGSMGDHPQIFRNIYLCRAEGKVLLSSEHEQYKWVKALDLANYNFPEDNDFQFALKNLVHILAELNLDKSYSNLS